MQDDLYGWSTFTNVPYLLGCASPHDPATASFAECGATGTARTSVPPSLLSTVEQAVSLSHVSATPDDVWLGLYANDLLLPGHVPQYQTRDPELLRCAPGSTRSACVIDGDGDGHPAAGDCDDTDPAIHPEAQTRDPSDPAYVDEIGWGTDHNCESWPR